MKKMKQSRKAGFTLVEIMIVVAIIGLLAAIAIPNFVKARATSQQNACINNMRQISAAVNEWALETGQVSGSAACATAISANSAAETDLSPYIQLNSNSSIPPCPAGGTYTVADVGTLPQVTCSLSTLGSEPHKSP
jgi:prepilin-type N-terminal cleavage/methylation domain-containing protein